MEQQDTQTEQEAKAEAVGGADTGKPGEGAAPGGAGGQAEASAAKELAALNDKYVRLFAGAPASRGRAD